MSLLLRKLLSRSRAASSEFNGVFSPHIIASRVWLSDHDVLAHMNNSKYAEFAQFGVEAFLQQTGAKRIMKREGWSLVTRFEHLSFIKMMKFPQRFSVETQLEGWSGNRFCFTQTFVSSGRNTALCRKIIGINGGGGSVSASELISRLEVSAESPTLSTEWQRELREIDQAQ